MIARYFTFFEYMLVDTDNIDRTQSEIGELRQKRGTEKKKKKKKKLTIRRASILSYSSLLVILDVNFDENSEPKNL